MRCTEDETISLWNLVCQAPSRLQSKTADTYFYPNHYYYFFFRSIPIPSSLRASVGNLKRNNCRLYAILLWCINTHNQEIRQREKICACQRSKWSEKHKNKTQIQIEIKFRCQLLKVNIFLFFWFFFFSF